MGLVTVHPRDVSETESLTTRPFIYYPILFLPTRSALATLAFTSWGGDSEYAVWRTAAFIVLALQFIYAILAWYTEPDEPCSFEPVLPMAEMSAEQRKLRFPNQFVEKAILTTTKANTLTELKLDERIDQLKGMIIMLSPEMNSEMSAEMKSKILQTFEKEFHLAEEMEAIRRA